MKELLCIDNAIISNALMSNMFHAACVRDSKFFNTQRKKWIGIKYRWSVLTVAYTVKLGIASSYQCYSQTSHHEDDHGNGGKSPHVQFEYPKESFAL
jgi:hypothetical protein